MSLSTEGVRSCGLGGLGLIVELRTDDGRGLTPHISIHQLETEEAV